MSVRLADHAPDESGGFATKRKARSALKDVTRSLTKLQYLLYAENKRGLLIVLQGMDASGKDGTIRRVMRGVNPQGTRVTSFKKPSAEELDHDFLWRIHRAVPRFGDIGIFNRSHYEDVADNGIVMLKFYLHISKDEQKRRFEDRLNDPARHWKISPADFAERPHWDAYTEAFEDALSRCSTPWAPWYVIPADNKWFRDLAVASVLVEKLQSMEMEFPEPSFDVSQITVE
jgi:polyphosphate kinase 2 (PPK2 family)